MSEQKRIGRSITAYPSDNRTHVGVRITEGGVPPRDASIWLSPEEADEHIRQVALARIELSKAKPKS